MATQTKSPGTIVEGNVFGYGTYHWSNIGNLASSNNVYATVTASGPSDLYTFTPVCTNFGFTIPAGSTINSITVLVEGKVDGGTARVDWTSLMQSGSPTLMHASGLLAADNTPDFPFTGSDVTYSIIPAADPLWGRAWSVADVNDATFGCAFDCYIQSLRTISADHVQITIDYTEGEEPTVECYGIPCDEPMDFDLAFKRAMAKAVGGLFSGCVGFRIYPVNVGDCENLTDLKDCGENLTLEQAFKKALIVDECGNLALRVFAIPREAGPR